MHCLALVEGSQSPQNCEQESLPFFDLRTSIYHSEHVGKVAESFLRCFIPNTPRWRSFQRMPQRGTLILVTAELIGWSEEKRVVAMGLQKIVFLSNLLGNVSSTEEGGTVRNPQTPKRPRRWGPSYRAGHQTTTPTRSASRGPSESSFSEFTTSTSSGTVTASSWSGITDSTSQRTSSGRVDRVESITRSTPTPSAQPVDLSLMTVTDEDDLELESST